MSLVSSTSSGFGPDPRERHCGGAHAVPELVVQSGAGSELGGSLSQHAPALQEERVRLVRLEGLTLPAQVWRTVCTKELLQKSVKVRQCISH